MIYVLGYYGQKSDSCLSLALGIEDLSKLRIYFTAQNLYTLTNYSGYDPEIGSFN